MQNSNINAYDTSISILNNNHIKNAITQKSDISILTQLRLNDSMGSLHNLKLTNQFNKTICIENVVDEKQKLHQETLKNFNLGNTHLKLNSVYLKRDKNKGFKEARK